MSCPDIKVFETPPEDTRVGFMSRIDYCGPGFRLGMVVNGRAKLDAEETNFDVLLGGLVSGPDVDARVKRSVREARSELRETNAELPPKSRVKFDIAPVVDRELMQIATELADVLPKRKRANGQGWVKLYIMVSPIAYLDGQYGARIAELLASLRPDDICFWTNPDEHFPLEPVPHPNFKNIACLVPVTAQFKSRYDSTATDYIIEDYLNRGKDPAELVVVGCVGSHFYKPKGGESFQHFISLPLLHKPQYKKRSPENQVGVVVVKMTTDGELLITNHNCNDLVRVERSTIKISEQFSERERRLLELFRDRPWWTSGLIDDRFGRALGLDRSGIDEMLRGIVDKCATENLQPTLVYDDSSKRYYIDSKWLQKHLEYLWPNGGFVKDRFLAFACLHALSRKADLRSFIDQSAEIMLKYDIPNLIGAGDFIEGREHGLADKGDVIAGADYSQQEEMAAKVVSEPLLRVFDFRFAQKVALLQNKNPQSILDLIRKTLPNFYYRAGNHDEWLTRHGVGILRLFRSELCARLRRGIVAQLVLHDLPFISGIDELVDAKVVHRHSFVLASGLDVRTDHLHKGGSATKSMNNQILLRSRKERVVVHGNFHIVCYQNRFRPEVGQRFVVQVPTVKRDHPEDSDFESNKGKLLDSGLCYGEVCSRDGRIIETTSIFFNLEGDFTPFNNQNILDAYTHSIGIRKM